MILIKLLLVDDHVLFAKSLSIALSDLPEIERFTSTKEVFNLVSIVRSEQPDILLMDINLGRLTDGDGLLLTKRILEHFPEQRVVILSGYDLPVYRNEAKKAGAKGFVNKEVEPQELLHILHAIEAGETYFPQENILIEELTESEKQILSLVALGKKRKAIAQQLFLSERTVSNHLQNIFDKLEVSSALEAVSKGIKLGYISP